MYAFLKRFFYCQLCDGTSNYNFLKLERLYILKQRRNTIHIKIRHHKFTNFYEYKQLGWFFNCIRFSEYLTIDV